MLNALKNTSHKLLKAFVLLVGCAALALSVCVLLPHQAKAADKNIGDPFETGQVVWNPGMNCWKLNMEINTTSITDLKRADPPRWAIPQFIKDFDPALDDWGVSDFALTTEVNNPLGIKVDIPDRTHCCMHHLDTTRPGSHPCEFVTDDITPTPTGWKGIFYFIVYSNGGDQAELGLNRVVVEWENVGHVDLQKESANHEISDSNPCYSLKGAQYGLYASRADAINGTDPVRTLTTDEGGYAKEENIKCGTYYAKEIKPSPGYLLDESEPYVVTIKPNETTRVNDYTVKEMPGDDPIGVLVAKKDADSGEFKGQGDGTLFGAEFTCEFYPGYFDSADAARASGKPARTWVYATDEKGKVHIRYDDPIRGDKPFINYKGKRTMPYGTYIYYETKAPTGYLLPDKPSVFVTRIVYDADTPEFYRLEGDVFPTEGNLGTSTTVQKEKAIYGGVTVEKRDDDTHESNAQGDATLEGITYEIVNRSYGSVVTSDGVVHAPNTVCEQITTHKDGNRYVATTNKLPYGDYEIYELSANNSYHKCDFKREFSIRENGEQIVYQNENASYDSVFRGGLAVGKIDRERQEHIARGDATLENCEFSIFNASAADVVVNGNRYKPGEWIMTINTNADGIAQTPANLLPYGTYKVKESAEPNGYLLNYDWSTLVEVHEDGKITDATSVAQSAPNQVKRGDISVVKADAELGESYAQGDATLEGITYEITNKSRQAVMVDGKVYQPGEVCDRITTRYDGTRYIAKMPEHRLAYGTYTVREVKSNGTYLNDGYEKTVTIDDENQHVELADLLVWSEDTVCKGGVRLGKADAETGSNVALGGATLGGAEFCITNKSRADVVVDGTRYKPGEVCKVIYTERDGVAQTSANALPYGTYEVHETKAPLGYLINSKWTRTFQVRADGQIANFFNTRDIIAEQVKRGDFYFLKKDDTTQRPLGGIPFAITSMTTGERHIVMSDQNGVVDTTAYPHSFNTNACDKALNTKGELDVSKLTAESGVWFSGQKTNGAHVNDGKGALVYDTYFVQELVVPANYGKKLVSFPVYIQRDKKCVDLGTVFNKPGERISSEFRSEGLTHTAALDHKAHFIDTVTFENLNVGEKYVLEGVLVDASDNTFIEGKDGAPYRTRIEFTPTTTSGFQNIDFFVDTYMQRGKTIVAYEYIYNAKGEKVNSEANSDNTLQTIHVPGLMHTYAQNKALKSNLVFADKGQTVSDSVSYDNLVPGEKYTLVSTLMDKDTGKPVADKHGNVITMSKTFVAWRASGFIETEFSFDASNLSDKTLVVFESLRQGNTEVARHKDLQDERQTLIVPGCKTSAAFSDTATREHDAADSLKIVDTVKYSNLIVDKTYTLVGVLMDKETGKPVADKHGNAYTKTLAFTPKKAAGEVVMSFDVDGNALAGKTCVVFEQILLDGHVVCEHKDLNSENQTVKVKARPGEPQTCPPCPKPCEPSCPAPCPQQPWMPCLPWCAPQVPQTPQTPQTPQVPQVPNLQQQPAPVPQPHLDLPAPAPAPDPAPAPKVQPLADQNIPQPHLKSHFPQTGEVIGGVAAIATGLIAAGVALVISKRKRSKR